jgi:hypothetical protein
MPIRVYKIADIIDRVVVFSGIRRFKQGDLAAILTNLEVPSDPNPDSAWQLEIIIGEGVRERRVPIDLPPILSNSYTGDAPIFLPESRPTPLAYFRERLFMSERPPLRDAERDEVELRIKKVIYEEEAELSSLRAAVANLEAAIEFQRSGLRRDPIPEDVKLLVWARDGGGCVRCGSKHGLHFDHIIPVAKGGGNTEANIQILCQICNLKKSDKIAIP